jgi:O-antigen ligase
LAVWLSAPRFSASLSTPFSTSLDRAIDAVLILFPAWIGLQLVPLPLAWLRVISPARAELQSALFPLGLGAGRAPLSAAPALTLAHLLRVLCFICVFYLIRELTRRVARARSSWTIALPVIALGCGEAALGLAQYFGGAGRATGTYVNPNHYACFLHMALPFPLAFAAISMGRGPGHENGSGSLKRALLACGLLGCAALIFLGALYSLSRMGAAAMAASLLVLACLAGNRNQAGRFSAAAAATAFVLILLISAPASLLERFGNAENEPLTADARVQIWRETLHMAADYRVFGSGLGTYGSVFQKYRASVPLYLVDFAHNDYLQLLAELGAIGFAVAIAAGLMILIRIVQAARAGATSTQRLMAAACAAALVALMLDSSADFDFYIPANAMLAAWIAGMGTMVGTMTGLESQKKGARA